MNYNDEMEKLIKSFDGKRSLLLHSCCGPCSSAVIERLKDIFDITVFYYNPNIEDQKEYNFRLNEQLKLLKTLGINCIIGEHDTDAYSQAVAGEEERERSHRCYECYKLRLEKTYKKALEEGFEYFGTTLSVSPHKNADWLNEIGLELESDKTKFLVADFKKKNGYLRSLELSKIYNLERQNYCGCEISKRKRED